MTSSRSNGICCLASYSTICATLLDSTGGKLMNRASEVGPGKLIATRAPSTSLASRNVSMACGINSSGIASGWLRILGWGMYWYPMARTWSAASA